MLDMLLCWICYYVGDNICDIYVVLVRVHSQLVAISHSVHMIYVFSIFHILQSAYAYDLGPISPKFSFQE